MPHHQCSHLTCMVPRSIRFERTFLGQRFQTQYDDRAARARAHQVLNRTSPHSDGKEVAGSVYFKLRICCQVFAKKFNDMLGVVALAC